MTSRLESDQEVRDSEISSSSTLAKVLLGDQKEVLWHDDDRYGRKTLGEINTNTCSSP